MTGYIRRSTGKLVYERFAGGVQFGLGFGIGVAGPDHQTRQAGGRADGKFFASFDGSVKLDFTAIANEQVTFFHDSKNQSLHVIFADGSQIIIEPFFNSMGVMSNFIFEMAPGEVLDSAQFASQFPITRDQSVLPALTESPTKSGAEFNDPSIDSLPPTASWRCFRPKSYRRSYSMKRFRCCAPIVEDGGSRGGGGSAGSEYHQGCVCAGRHRGCGRRGDQLHDHG